MEGVTGRWCVRKKPPDEAGERLEAWAERTGLSFGVERDFQIKHEESNEVRTIRFMTLYTEPLLKTQ